MAKSAPVPDAPRLFDDDIPERNEEDAPESISDLLARQQVYDAWNAAFLKRFYLDRANAILASGDPVRIRLLAEHNAREAQRG